MSNRTAKPIQRRLFLAYQGLRRLYVRLRVEEERVKGRLGISLAGTGKLRPQYQRGRPTLRHVDR